MRVWEIADTFGLENLTLVERPDPEPGPGQVLVRLDAVSLNYRDRVVVAGSYGRHIVPPLVPLSDGAGQVVAVGPGVGRVAVGDRVATLFFQDWVGGEPSPTTFRSTLGGPLDGVLAEAIVLGQEGVARVPEHLSHEEAACLPCAALTAWSALITQGRLEPGQCLVVQGTGGVSLFALQFAKMAGVEVIVTSSSDAKLARARQMGADHGINYVTTPDWDKAVKEITRGQGCDHVIEVGGADTLERALRAIRVGGTISLIGVLSGAEARLTLPLVVTRNIRLQGVTVGSRQGFEAMSRAIALNAMRPVVDRVFPFEKAPDALRTMGEGKHFGKICIATR